MARLTPNLHQRFFWVVKIGIVFAARQEVPADVIAQTRLFGRELIDALPVRSQIGGGGELVADQDQVAMRIGAADLRAVEVVHGESVDISDVLFKLRRSLLPGGDRRPIVGRITSEV